MNRHNRITRKIYTIAFLASLFLSPMLIFGQTTRQVLYPQGSKNQIHKQKTPCAGGWRGIVTFSKTLKESFQSDEPGIRKSIDRIMHKTSRDYEYNGRAVVDGSDPQNTKVNTNVSFNDTDLHWGLEKVFDTCNSRENGHWFNIEGTDDKQTQAQVTGSAKSFNLSVNEFDGTYQFSLTTDPQTKRPRSRVSRSPLIAKRSIPKSPTSFPVSKSGEMTGKELFGPLSIR